MARVLLESGAFQLAQQTAHLALEEAAGAVGGESEKEASAQQRGVSLARNVLANAADEVAQQGWAVAVALNERLERRLPDVVAAVTAVQAAAMDAAGAVDAQLGDAELKARASAEEMAKLEAKRAQSTALLERATDLLRSLRAEAAEQATGVQAAERAVVEADAERERERLRDELQAVRLQMEGMRDENEQLAFSQAQLRTERDEAIETRDDVLAAAAQERATPMPAAEHGSQPDARPANERLKDKLKEGHWTFCRQDGGHPIYKRTVVKEGEAQTSVQTFSHAATPSDIRSLHNSISDLRAMDNGVEAAYPLADGGAQGALFAKHHYLQRERKEAEKKLFRIEEEIVMVESELGDW